MAVETLGLLRDCTGYDEHPSGPWGLKRGGLVRNVRPSADGRQSLLEYSRTGDQWSEFLVYSDQLEIGDAAAIRAELAAEQPVPAPPEGATCFVWCWSAGDAGFSYAAGKRPETYRSTFWAPTRWQSCFAFDEAGEFLGLFSPSYPDWGWQRPDAFSHGPTMGLSVAESLQDARRALRLEAR
jgi:hypothetical protein